MKLAVAGLSGRMGQAIQALAGSDIELIALPREGSLNAAKHASAVIDFTRPDYSLRVLEFARAHGLPFVCGTTGFTPDEMAQMKQAAGSIPVFWASNMSVGVALVARLVREAAAQLDAQYDIEILEMHHRHKVDAPSGTALMLGRAAAAGRGVDFEAKAVLARAGHCGEREAGSIGFAALRGGQVIGDHAVLFAGEHEVIEIAHRAASRSIYAQGALRAALWLTQKPAGFYTMDDLVA